jgi:hypothetical protein
MDDPKYDVFKARLIKIATAIEEHQSMHEKPLLRMYQSPDIPSRSEKARRFAGQMPAIVRKGRNIPAQPRVIGKRSSRVIAKL